MKCLSPWNEEWTACIYDPTRPVWTHYTSRDKGLQWGIARGQRQWRIERTNRSVYIAVVVHCGSQEVSLNRAKITSVPAVLEEQVLFIIVCLCVCPSVCLSVQKNSKTTEQKLMWFDRNRSLCVVVNNRSDWIRRYPDLWPWKRSAGILVVV